MRAATRRGFLIVAALTAGCAVAGGPLVRGPRVPARSPAVAPASSASSVAMAATSASGTATASATSDGSLVLEAPHLMTAWKDSVSRLGLADLPGRTFVVGLDRMAYLADGKVVFDPALEAGLGHGENGRLFGWVGGVFGRWPSAAWLQQGGTFYRWQGDAWSKVGATPWMCGDAVGWNGGVIIDSIETPSTRRLLVFGASPLPPPLPALGAITAECNPKAPLVVEALGADAAGDPVVGGMACNSVDRHVVLRWPAGKSSWSAIGPKNFWADRILPVPGTADGMLLVGAVAGKPRAVRIVAGKTTELDLPPHTDGEHLRAYVETSDGAVTVIGEFMKGRLAARDARGAWHDLVLTHPKVEVRPYDAWRIGDEVYVAADLRDGGDGDGTAAIYRLADDR